MKKCLKFRDASERGQILHLVFVSRQPVVILDQFPNETPFTIRSTFIRIQHIDPLRLLHGHRHQSFRFEYPHVLLYEVLAAPQAQRPKLLPDLPPDVQIVVQFNGAVIWAVPVLSCSSTAWTESLRYRVGLTLSSAVAARQPVGNRISAVVLSPSSVKSCQLFRPSSFRVLPHWLETVLILAIVGPFQPLEHLVQLSGRFLGLTPRQ